VGFDRILVPYDGSRGSKRALEVALDLALAEGAEVLGVAVAAHLPRFGATVGEVDEERRVEEAQARTHLEEAAAYAAARGVALRTEIRAGNAAHAILQAAEDHDVDLIVLGHSGVSGLWGHFVGTTADRVSEHARCSVLIAR
jgi:nucleotide-binding universal stress UspA family protein